MCVCVCMYVCIWCVYVRSDGYYCVRVVFCVSVCGVCVCEIGLILCVCVYVCIWCMYVRSDWCYCVFVLCFVCVCVCVCVVCM